MAGELKLAILVEKKAGLRKEIASQLESLGFEDTIRCSEPPCAQRIIESQNRPGLLVIGNSDDVGKCHNLIKYSRAQMAHWTIIVLDHINSEKSIFGAFSAGADDVLHVPFSYAEFAARLTLRITQATEVKKKVLSTVPTVFDDILLTHTEHKIINYLVMHKGKTVTRNELARHVDDKEWEYGDRKYDVHITNIRNKLKKKPDTGYTVKSVRSVGYYIQESSDEKL